jgi:fibronectin-binding autotransporter adhesin
VVLGPDAVLDKSGTGSSLDSSATLINNGTVRFSSGTFAMQSRSRLFNRGVFEFAGDLTLNGGGDFINSGTVLKSAGAGTARFAATLATSGAENSAGRWTINTGTLNLDQNASGTFDGAPLVVNAGAGALAFTNGTFNLWGLAAAPGSTVAFSGATARFNGAYVNEGTTTISAGSTLVMVSGGSFRNAATGTLGGAGTLDMTASGSALRNDGAIAPGAAGSAGTLTVLGDVDFGATGSLNIERFGNTSVDRLAVSGAAALAGGFSWTDAAPTIRSDGSTHTVMTYGSKSGTFTTLSLPLLHSATYLTDRLNINTPVVFLISDPAIVDAVNRGIASVKLSSNFPAILVTTPPASGGTTPPVPSCSSARAMRTGACAP